MEDAGSREYRDRVMEMNEVKVAGQIIAFHPFEYNGLKGVGVTILVPYFVYHEDKLADGSHYSREMQHHNYNLYNETATDIKRLGVGAWVQLQGKLGSKEGKNSYDETYYYPKVNIKTFRQIDPPGTQPPMNPIREMLNEIPF